jgi:ABC-type transport system involved in multi-copper enzyme maturation permease subunit
MALLGISLLKLARRPASWVVLLILLGLIGLVFIGLAASAGQITDPERQLQVRLILSFPAAYSALVGIMLSFGGLLAVTYGATIIGSEWSWGTIRAVVARGESRIRYTLVTFGAIAIAIAIAVFIAFFTGVMLALVAASIAGTSTDGALDLDTILSFPDLLARTWLGITEQAAIGFAIAMLFRSQLAGIGAGLAFYFGEIFLAFVPLVEDVLPYFPFNVATAVVTSAEGPGGGGGFGGGPSQLESGTAVVLAVAYLGIALVIASLAAWRAQITQ